MALTDLQIDALVAKYRRERDRYEKMASTVHRLLQSHLAAAATPCLVTFRAKDERSLRSKLIRERASIVFAEVEHEFFPRLLDLAGARVLLYRPEDVDPACGLIEQAFTVPPEQRFRKNHAHPKGYRARHRVATLREEARALDPNLANLQGVHCEIQVTTIIDHIWNEPEHDIRYKSATGDPSAEQAAYLRGLRAQLDAAADTVTALMVATAEEVARKKTALQGPEELRRALETMHARALRGDFAKLYDVLSKTHRTLTAALLAGLPLKQSDLAAARERLATLGLEAKFPNDDVILFLLALWSDYADDIQAIAAAWPDRSGPLDELIQILGQRDTNDADP